MSNKSNTFEIDVSGDRNGESVIIMIDKRTFTLSTDAALWIIRAISDVLLNQSVKMRNL